MVASSIKRSVVKVMRPASTRTGNFHFEDDIGIRPGVLIRPDTQFINSIGYTIYVRLLFQRITNKEIQTVNEKRHRASRINNRLINVEKFK